MSLLEVTFVAALLAALVYLVCREIFRAYFREKEAFVDRLIRKVKGVGDGKVK